MQGKPTCAPRIIRAYCQLSTIRFPQLLLPRSDLTGIDRIIGQDGVWAGSLTEAGVISLEEVPGILKRYLPDSGLREVAYTRRKYCCQLNQFRRRKRHRIVAGIDG